MDDGAALALQGVGAYWPMGRERRLISQGALDPLIPIWPSLSPATAPAK